MSNFTDNCRLCRREGAKLFLKSDRCYSPKCPIDKKGAVPPGQHGAKKRRNTSDYGLQLREKQKTRRYYGIEEKQMQRYFDKAMKIRGATGSALLRFLELRLDNAVYRAGLAPSRSVARQLVSHGHVSVDNHKVDVPSFQVKPGNILSLDATSLAIKEVKTALADKNRKLPEWVSRKAAVAHIVRLPEREEVDLDINEYLIVEYYSR